MENRKAATGDVLRLIAGALNVDPGSVKPISTADDFDEWDSMGTMALLSMIDVEFDLQLPPGQVEELRSVPTILGLLRRAGKLE